MPRLNITRTNMTVLARLGETIALQTSTDLPAWVSIATNTLNTTNWTIPIVPAGNRFYRAAAVP
jgi:hypothetical protein